MPADSSPAAQRQRAQNLLVGELSRLFEPSNELTKLAVANIETRNMTQAVVDGWKPIVANAIQEWARQRALTAVLTNPAPAPDAPESSSKMIATEEELAAFAALSRVLGVTRPIEYEDSATYFKVYVARHRTWVVARLQMDRKNRQLWVPLPPERISACVGSRPTTVAGQWTSVSIAGVDDLAALTELLSMAHSSVLKERNELPANGS